MILTKILIGVGSLDLEAKINDFLFDEDLEKENLIDIKFVNDPDMLISMIIYVIKEEKE